MRKSISLMSAGRAFQAQLQLKRPCPRREAVSDVTLIVVNLDLTLYTCKKTHMQTVWLSLAAVECVLRIIY